MRNLHNKVEHESINSTASTKSSDSKLYSCMENTFKNIVLKYYTCSQRGDICDTKLLLTHIHSIAKIIGWSVLQVAARVGLSELLMNVIAFSR